MNRLNRRQFLAGAAAGWLVLRGGASARGYPANEKLGIAIVGCGIRGRWFVSKIPNMENVVALCDVNGTYAAKTFALLPKVPKFHDYRKMLDELDRQIDGVIVAASDNPHAVVSVAAMKAGKHVLCEKPLTHDVAEARVMRETAATCRVATQMGNQGTAGASFRRALALIRDGRIGEVREVHVWNTKGGAAHPKPPEGTAKIQETLKWDLWLGPAADRPFHYDWLDWGRWRDFATGQLGNWATHSANLAFMALGVDSLWSADAATKPRVRVEARVEKINRLSFPKWEIVRFEIPARGDLPPLTLTWHNGVEAPGSRERIEALIGDDLDWGDKKAKKNLDHAGAVIVGSKGKIHATGHNATFRLLPEEAGEDVHKRPKNLELAAMSHVSEWLAACRGGKPAWSNFNYAGPLTEFLLLGNIATQVDHGFEFDPLACRIVDSEAADRLLRRRYREGWSL